MQYTDLLKDWNAKINLVSRKDMDRLETKHLAHCLTITHFLRLMPKAQIPMMSNTCNQSLLRHHTYQCTYDGAEINGVGNTICQKKLVDMIITVMCVNKIGKRMRMSPPEAGLSAQLGDGQVGNGVPSDA